MAGDQSDETDKSFEPTAHKLNEARKKGEFARSADLNTAGGYAGFLLAGLMGGAASIDILGNAMMVLLDQAGPISELMFAGTASNAIGAIFGVLLSGLAIWFLLPAGVALLSALAQRSVVFAPVKLKPKLSRIGLIQNAKNKYGLSGLFEFAKSFVKLLLFSVLLASFLVFRMPEMAGSLHATPAAIGTIMMQMLIEFLFIVVVISLVVGAADYLWHHFDHLRRHRMSHREVKEENKEQEGDPMLKQERRQRAGQISSEQVAAAIPSADVVIVNPTHYAVALKWSRQKGSAPECVAKGVDNVARTIRKIAAEHGVPIRSDPPTARALYASTEVGQEIDPRHYRAVAAAIRFAETIRKRARYWS